MSEVETLKREVDDLKDLNTRLSKELQKCLVMLGVDAPKGVDVPGDLPPWAVNATFLSPILLSYDNRIHELETSLDVERRKFDELSETSRRITAENGQIREEMERRWKDMIEKQKQDFEHGSTGAVLYTEERNELQERVELLNQEVNILIEQLETFRANNEYLEKFSRERDDFAEKAGNQYRQLVTEFQEGKLAMEEFKNQRDIVEDRLKKNSEQLATLEKEREGHITENNRITNELRVIKQQSEHYRKAYEELDYRKSTDIETLMLEKNAYQQKEVDATNRTIMQEKELEETKEMLRAYKRDLDTTKSDANNMMKILEDYETKVTTLQQKEEGLTKQAKDCLQKMEEACTEKDRIQLHEQTLLRQLDRISEQKRLELQEQQNKYEALHESTRAKHESVLRARDEEIRAIAGRANDFQQQFEERNRECDNLKNMYDNAYTSLKDEQNKIHYKMNDNDKRARESEELRLIEKRKYESLQEQFNNEQQDWERVKRNFDENSQSHRKELENTRRNGQIFSDDNRRLKSQIEDLVKERDTLIKELNSIRQSYYERLQEASNEFNTKLSSLEHQLIDAYERQKFSEDRAIELLKAQDSISDRWKGEHQKVITYYDKILNQLNEENLKLRDETSNFT